MSETFSLRPFATSPAGPLFTAFGGYPQRHSDVYMRSDRGCGWKRDVQLTVADEQPGGVEHLGLAVAHGLPMLPPESVHRWRRPLLQLLRPHLSETTPRSRRAASAPTSPLDSRKDAAKCARPTSTSGLPATNNPAARYSRCMSAALINSAQCDIAKQPSVSSSFSSSSMMSICPRVASLLASRLAVADLISRTQKSDMLPPIRLARSSTTADNRHSEARRKWEPPSHHHDGCPNDHKVSAKSLSLRQLPEPVQRGPDDGSTEGCDVAIRSACIVFANNIWRSRWANSIGATLTESAAVQTVRGSAEVTAREQEPSPPCDSTSGRPCCTPTVRPSCPTSL